VYGGRRDRVFVKQDLATIFGLKYNWNKEKLQGLASHRRIGIYDKLLTRENKFIEYKKEHSS